MMDAVEEVYLFRHVYHCQGAAVIIAKLCRDLITPLHYPDALAVDVINLIRLMQIGP
jgi:hypothetical protein